MTEQEAWHKTTLWHCNQVRRACIRLKKTILRELVAPWAVPVCNWINKIVYRNK